MLGAERGTPACGYHHVWSDHRFVVINQRIYYGMLNVAGLAFANLKAQYVEWFATSLGGADWQWYKASEPERPWIYIADTGREFRDKYEGTKKVGFAPQGAHFK